MDCTWSTSFYLCFQHCVASTRSVDADPPPLCSKTERQGAVDSYFASHHRRMRAALQLGITGRDVQVSGKVTYFCSPLLVCWRELQVSLLSTQLVTLSHLTAGAKPYKSLPMRHVQMLHECSCIMHVTSKCIPSSVLNLFCSCNRAAAHTLALPDELS